MRLLPCPGIPLKANSLRADLHGAPNGLEPMAGGPVATSPVAEPGKFCSGSAGQSPGKGSAGNGKARHRGSQECGRPCVTSSPSGSAATARCKARYRREGGEPRLWPGPPRAATSHSVGQSPFKITVRPKQALVPCGRERPTSQAPKAVALPCETLRALEGAPKEGISSPASLAEYSRRHGTAAARGRAYGEEGWCACGKRKNKTP